MFYIYNLIPPLISLVCSKVNRLKKEEAGGGGGGGGEEGRGVVVFTLSTCVCVLCLGS